MANHLHRQIRDALGTALTGLSTTGTNVFTNRIVAVPDNKLPALCISADSETSENVTMGTPALQERALSVAIEARAKKTASADLDDLLDQISKEVEVAMSVGITLSGQRLDFTYNGMEFDDEQSDKPAGIKRLRYSVSFTALSNAPDVLS